MLRERIAGLADERFILSHNVTSTSSLDAGIPAEPWLSLGLCNGEPLPLIQPNRLFDLCDKLKSTGLTIEQFGKIILGDEIQGNSLSSLKMSREEAPSAFLFQVALQSHDLSGAEKAAILPYITS